MDNPIVSKDVRSSKPNDHVDFPDDVYLVSNIMDQLDLDDLLNFCRTNPETNRVCHSDEYWKNRLRSTFGNKLEGLFLSGNENLPILEGHHSISEYVYVERELTNAILDISKLDLEDYGFGQEIYLANLINTYYETNEIEISTIMYLLRHSGTDNVHILHVIMHEVSDGNYPKEFLLEYLEAGNPYESPNSDLESWIGLIIASDDDSTYNDLWTRIFELGTYPYRVIGQILDDSENDYLRNLALQYE